MTWKELREFIDEMEPRFLDTNVQVYDVENGITLIDAMFVTDCNDDDYLIDKDQPQIFVNFDEFSVD